VPQLILVRRVIHMGNSTINLKEESVIENKSGADEIMAWVANGAPVRGEVIAGSTSRTGSLSSR
jgi:hypothetical protein